MKLNTKLVILSVFTIIIPMLIIVFFSAFLLYRNNSLSQWKYLETVKGSIETDVTETQRQFLESAKEIAEYDFVRDKVYVYSKYWDRFSESLIAYDLVSLDDFINNVSLINGIDSIAIYRTVGSSFYYCSSVGSMNYLSEILYREIEQENYSKALFIRYPDEMFLRITYPIFSEGRLVGLVVLMKDLNKSFFSRYVNTYGVNIAFITKGLVYFNSNPDTDNYVLSIVENQNEESRLKFDASDISYSGIISSYNLGESTTGQLILYQEKTNLLSQNDIVIQNLVLMVVICILIPVVTFFIKEIRLIKSINSLLDATNRISLGDYESSVAVKSKDEIGALSSNFNSMVAALKKQKDSLETKNAELLVKNSYIDAVFQSLQINILVVDEQFKIRVVSKNAGSRLELTEEHVGSDITLTPPFAGEAQTIIKELQTVFSEGQFKRLSSVQFGNISYEIDLFPVHEENDRIGAVVLILQNITEKMEMERALVQSDRLASVGQLAAGLAHEINNPMGIILNHLQLLESDNLSENERRRFMIRMETEIKRVSRLVNNLLRFSRDDSSKTERLNPTSIISEVLHLIDPKLSTKTGDNNTDQYNLIFDSRRIVVVLHHVQENIHLDCTRDNLKQVILNILKNSFQSLDDSGGIVEIYLTSNKAGTEIVFSDNGEGISEKDLNKVFDPFFSHRKTGTGLGLSLCKTMMHRVGGSINITSKKGSGTTVTLKYPYKDYPND